MRGSVRDSVLRVAIFSNVNLEVSIGSKGDIKPEASVHCPMSWLNSGCQEQLGGASQTFSGSRGTLWRTQTLRYRPLLLHTCFQAHGRCRSKHNTRTGWQSQGMGLVDSIRVKMLHLRNHHHHSINRLIPSSTASTDAMMISVLAPLAVTTFLSDRILTSTSTRASVPPTIEST